MQTEKMPKPLHHASGEMAERIRNFDWSATTLGSISSWPDRLVAAVEGILYAPYLATLAIGKDRIFIYNDEVLEHYGRRHPEVLSTPLRDAFPHEFAAVEGYYDRAFGGESLHIPAQSLDPSQSGTAEIFDAYLTPIRDVDGTVLAVQMVGFAASSRIEAERQARSSEERLRLAFDTLPLGIALVDAAGETVMANHQMRRFLPTGRIPSRDPERQWRWKARNPDGTIVPPQDFPSARALRGETVSPGMQLIYCEDDGSEVWTEVFSAPLRHEGGSVIGAISVVVDVDRIKRSEEAAMASEERLRQFGDASKDVLWIRDAGTMQWVYLTAGFEKIYGLSRLEAFGGNDFAGWLNIILAEDRAMVINSLIRISEGESLAYEFRIKRQTDGAIRWIRNTDFPIFDNDGAVVRIGGIGHDCTEIREAELRHQILVEGIPQLVWRANVVGSWTWASSQWIGYTGQYDDRYKEWGWLQTFHPDDRESAREAWQRAPEQGGFDLEHRILNALSGEYRWFQTRAAPVRDHSGAIIEWLGTSTDINDLRLLQARQQVLVAELQHRTRNLIAVVQFTAEQTLASARSLDQFEEAFQDRLDALARVQGLLSRLQDHERVTFDQLLRTDLLGIGVLDGVTGSRVTLDGPPGVRLRSSSVQALAMALHELATNAVKYGAFAHPDGFLAVRWQIVVDIDDPRTWLHIDWRESGVPMQGPGSGSVGTGQGRVLIEQALPYQLQAKTSFTLGVDGVHCTLNIPISSHPSADGEAV